MKKFLLFLVFFLSAPAFSIVITPEDEQDFKSCLNPGYLLLDSGYENLLRAQVEKKIKPDARGFRLKSGIDVQATQTLEKNFFPAEQSLRRISTVTQHFMGEGKNPGICLSQSYGKMVNADFYCLELPLKLAIMSLESNVINFKKGLVIIKDVEIFHDYQPYQIWNLLGGISQSFPAHIVIRFLKPDNSGGRYAIFEKRTYPMDPFCFGENLLAVFTLDKAQSDCCQ